MMDLKGVLDLFTCKICKGMLRVPKHMPCDHDVCEHCLELHIIRTVPMAGYDLHELGREKVEVKPTQDFFICPADGCSNKYTVKYPKQNSVNWTSQVDNCIRRTHMMELFNGKRKCDTKHCDACIDSAERPKASVICTNCLRLYCENCTFIHKNLNPSHQIIDLADFENAYKVDLHSKKRDTDNVEVIVANKYPVTDKISNTENTSRFENASDGKVNVDEAGLSACPIHRPCEEVLICRNCDVLCCVKCRDNLHIKCKNVQSIELLYKRSSSSKLDDTIKTRLVTLLGQSALGISKCAVFDGRLRIIVASKKDVTLEMVQDYRAEIENIMKLFEFLYSKIKRLLVQIQQIGKHGHSHFVKVLFSVESDCLKLKEEFVRTESVTGKKLQKIYDFSHTEDTNEGGSFELPNSEPGLNLKVHVKYADVVDNLCMIKQESANDIVDAFDESVSQEDILAKSKSDENDCWLVDCKLLKNNEIILADAANQKIKLIDKDKQIQEVCLESIPCQLAINKEETECVVSVPDQKRVIVLNVKDGVLQICSDINLFCDIHFIGILNRNEMLIANKRGHFYLLDRSGRLEDVEVNFLEAQNESSLSPRYLKIVCNGIIQVFVSDFRLNLLVKCKLNKGLECNSKGQTDANQGIVDKDLPAGKSSIRAEFNESTSTSDHFGPRNISNGNSRNSTSTNQSNGDHVDNETSTVSDISFCDAQGNEITRLPAQLGTCNDEAKGLIFLEDGVMEKISEAIHGVPATGNREINSHRTNGSMYLQDKFLPNEFKPNYGHAGLEHKKKWTHGYMERNAGLNESNLQIDSLSNAVKQSVEDESQNYEENTIDATRMKTVKASFTTPNLEVISFNLVKYPTGLDIDQDGNIYICSNSEHCVLKLDREREHKSKLIEIALPRALSVGQNKFILTVDSSPKKNFVLVYSLRKN